MVMRVVMATLLDSEPKRLALRVILEVSQILCYVGVGASHHIAFQQAGLLGTQIT